MSDPRGPRDLTPDDFENFDEAPLPKVPELIKINGMIEQYYGRMNQGDATDKTRIRNVQILKAAFDTLCARIREAEKLDENIGNNLLTKLATVQGACADFSVLLFSRESLDNYRVNIDKGDPTITYAKLIVDARQELNQYVTRTLRESSQSLLKLASAQDSNTLKAELRESRAGEREMQGEVDRLKAEILKLKGENRTLREKVPQPGEKEAAAQKESAWSAEKTKLYASKHELEESNKLLQEKITELSGELLQQKSQVYELKKEFDGKGKEKDLAHEEQLKTVKLAHDAEIKESKEKSEYTLAVKLADQNTSYQELMAGQEKKLKSALDQAKEEIKALQSGGLDSKSGQASKGYVEENKKLQERFAARTQIFDELLAATNNLLAKTRHPQVPPLAKKSVTEESKIVIHAGGAARSRAEQAKKASEIIEGIKPSPPVRPRHAVLFEDKKTGAGEGVAAPKKSSSLSSDDSEDLSVSESSPPPKPSTPGKK